METESKKANSINLLKHCFNIMQKLEKKDIDVDEAKAHSNLIKQANNVLRYELDRAKTISQFGVESLRNIEE